jgi:hypothetical protein
MIYLLFIVIFGNFMIAVTLVILFGIGCFHSFGGNRSRSGFAPAPVLERVRPDPVNDVV